MRGAEQRPFGLPNFARDGAGGGSGKGRLQLLPGKTPLGEPIGRRQPELAKPTLREEINAYLAERARLRAEGQLPKSVSFGERPIITPADTISIDLLAFSNDLDIGNHSESTAKWRSVNRILWGFNAFAFGRMSHAIQEYVTVGEEFGQAFNRNHLQVFEDMERLNGEETAILADQLAKVDVPFKPRPKGITIPYAPTVAKMREIVGGEPLFLSLPPQNVTSINDHPRRSR